MKNTIKQISKLSKRLFQSSAEHISISTKSTELSIFDRSFYADITEARVNHLKALNLPLSNKSVIDLGCGIGRISNFFVNSSCNVLCVDGREENIQILRKHYPTYKSVIVNLETQDILNHGKFDIVSCYGLLYHLADPFGLLKNIYHICNEFVIIESCITDANEPILRLVKESPTDPTQALTGVGCRPSPAYIIDCLKLSGFKHIYEPCEMPNHPEFRYKRVNDFSYSKNGKLIRGIYIASHQPLKNSALKQI